MWWARSEPPVQAWLGAGRVARSLPDGDVVVTTIGSAQEGLGVLASSHKDQPGKKPVRLWLASDLCTLTCMPAIAGVKRLEEAQAAAAAWLQSQARVPAGWTPRLAECDRASAFWRVAACPDGLLEQIQRQLPVQSVRPWWSWALQQLDGRDRGLCAYDGAALVFCDWNAVGQLPSAETIGPVADIEAARRLLKRRSMQRPAGHVFAQLDWTAGDGPAAADAAFAFAPWVRWSDAL